jgi:hypothetical protein
MLVWRSSYDDVEVKLCWCGGQVMLMWRSSYVGVQNGRKLIIRLIVD